LTKECCRGAVKRARLVEGGRGVLQNAALFKGGIQEGWKGWGRLEGKTCPRQEVSGGREVNSGKGGKVGY